MEPERQTPPMKWEWWQDVALVLMPVFPLLITSNGGYLRWVYLVLSPLIFWMLRTNRKKRLAEEHLPDVLPDGFTRLDNVRAEGAISDIDVHYAVEIPDSKRRFGVFSVATPLPGGVGLIQGKSAWLDTGLDLRGAPRELLPWLDEASRHRLRALSQAGWVLEQGQLVLRKELEDKDVDLLAELRPALAQVRAWRQMTASALERLQERVLSDPDLEVRMEAVRALHRAEVEALPRLDHPELVRLVAERLDRVGEYQGAVSVSALGQEEGALSLSSRQRDASAQSSSR